MDYKLLLESKGFVLNEYPEGRLWELVEENDEDVKIHICEVFNAVIDTDENGTDIETIILQCDENYCNCIFCYDSMPYDMSTEEFIECISKI